MNPASKTYRLGDRVEVRVEAVNMDERKIDFSLISSERAPRNVGKTAREKAKKAMQAKKAASGVRSAKRSTLSQTAPFAARKTEAESSEERREKSEKAIGENAENSRSDQSEACGEEKSGRVIITLFKQKRVNYP